MATVIDAIINLVNNPKVDLIRHYKKNNRANDMGTALEEYIKDLFAGTLDETSDTVRNHRFDEVFSYLGNANNPPDSMLKDGDAIEVKKLKGFSTIQLNSSHPKRYLLKTNPKINLTCKNCPDWNAEGKRDMLYAVGVCDAEHIKDLCLVYGTELCADIEVYARYENTIKMCLQELDTVTITETNELGRLNKVDSLGITDFRIRGMWLLQNPFSVFNYVHKVNEENKFNLMCIINEEKYNGILRHTELETLAAETENLKIEDVKVKDPNNPAQLISCKLITYCITE